MAVNKVIYNTENGAETLIDLTTDSVTPETLAKGTVAHDASGNVITGTMKTVDELLENVTANDTLVWDGNTEGKTVFDMTGDGTYTYYPVSENVLSLDDLSNGLILESSDLNGNAFESMLLTDFAMMSSKIIASRTVSSVLFVLEDNAPLYSGTIPKKGIYFMHSKEFGYVSRIQIEGYTGFNSEVEVLKKKYLPDHTHDWDDLTDDCKTEINEYIADALSEAKASGEFDGKDGEDGKTPVKGVDYYTEADKAEWSEYIASELAKRGQLAPANAESLEWLEANGDQSKMYVLMDKTDPNYGFIYAWMLTEKEVEGGGGYTNALDDTTKHINQRWSRSSKAYSAANGYMATDLIPVSVDQKVYVNLPRVAFMANYSRIHYLDSSNNYVTTRDTGAYVCQPISTDEKGVTSWTVGYEILTNGSSPTKLTNADSITKMMLVFDIYDVAVTGLDAPSSGTFGTITEADVANLIVSIDNPIEEGGTEIIVTEGWASTGHAFVPANYEPRIIALENKTLRHTAEIAELQKAVENGGAGDANESAALTRIKEWDKPVYDSAPVTLLEDSRIKPALTTSDRTISAIYAKYRALMAAHPNYITETNMGKSTASSTFTAVDMLRFDFKEPGGLTQPDMGAGALHETKPTIIFLSGIHTEWVGVWGLYYALEEITTNPAFDDVRRNAHIVVIPCANPYCLDWKTSIDGWRMSHVNANGVAIHNNFGVDHSTSGSIGEYNYGGTAPYSELETQYIDAVMAEYPDAVAFVSCHNNDYSTYYGSHVIWASSATYHMCNVAFRLVDKLSKAWLDKYGDTLKTAIDSIKINMDASDYRLGRATMSSSKGTEQKNATKYGIQGVNLEISRMMKIFSGSTDGTSEVMTHGAEVYANFMRTLLANYDHNDKKDYAPNLPWSE